MSYTIVLPRSVQKNIWAGMVGEFASVTIA